MDALQRSHAAARTGWSARMLRYLEQAGLVVPSRTPDGYRLYGLRELNQLRVARRAAEPVRSRDRRRRVRGAAAPRARVRTAMDGWLADVEDRSWVESEQQHERLLAANRRNTWQRRSATT